MAYSTPGKTREQVYRYMRKRIIDGDPPTVREVQDQFGFKAVQSARAHLENLVTEGRLIKHEGKARGYGLPRTRDKRKRPTTEWVPVIASALRKPLEESMERPERYIPAQARRGKRMFALEVKGDSMKQAGLVAKDVVIARAQHTAGNGDLVVARVKNQAVVKRMKLRRGGRIELHTEGARAKSTVVVPESKDDILGVVVEVRREVRSK